MTQRRIFPMIGAIHVWMAVLLLGLSVLMPSTSLADPVGGGDRPIETVDENGNRIKCSELPEAKGGVILGYIVPCLVHTVETGTVAFSEAMIQWLRPLLFAFITFVVVMFGVKIVQAEGEVHKEGILLLLKIGAVIALLDMIPNFIVPQLYMVMAETQEVVMGGFDQTTLHCEVDKYGDGNTPVIWKNMDCLLGKLYGYSTGSDGHPNMVLASSVFGLLGGFFFSGTLGVTLFFACIGVLWTMFTLVLKTVFSFLNAYLYASVLLILSPLFMPLIMLKATSNYFEQWWKGILASILMPLVISSYVMIAMLLYDKMLFADDSLVQNLFNNEWVQKGQAQPRQACGRDLMRAPEARAEYTGQTEQAIMENPFMRNLINPFLSGGNNMCAGFRSTQFDLENLSGDDFENAREGFEKLFKDCIKLFFLAWLVNQGFTNVMQIVRRIIGAPAVAQTMDKNSPLELKFERAMSFGRQQLQSELRYDNREGHTNETLRGGQFLRQMPGALGASARGFMAGLSDDPEAFMRSTEPRRQESGSAADDGGSQQPSTTGSRGGPQRAGGRAADRGTSGAAARSPQQLREAADSVLGGADARRFAELQEQLSTININDPNYATLNSEYEALIEEIERRSEG